MLQVLSLLMAAMLALGTAGNATVLDQYASSFTYYYGPSDQLLTVETEEFVFDMVFGRARLRSYTGDGEVVEVPAIVEGNPVIAIQHAFPQGWLPLRITLPKTLLSIANPQMALASIRVDPENPVYADIDGVLFEKSSRTLLWYPLQREDPAYEVPEGIVAIGEYSFGDNATLTSVTLPQSLKTIGAYAFRGCTGLEALALPEGLESIGNNAFAECERLTSVAIPPEIRRLPERGFLNCTGLETVVLPEGLASVGADAFRGCRSLTAITLPDSLVDIAPSAFDGSGVTAFAVSADHPVFFTIDGVLFEKDTGALYRYPPGKIAAAYKVPEDVRIIEERAFSNCTLLRTMVLPQGVERIGNSAFSGCSLLEDPILPETVRTIGSGAFYGCSAFKQLVIPAGATDIRYGAFENCEGLVSVMLPQGLQNVPWAAFSGCRLLEEIVFPEGLQGIWQGAFAGCISLTALDLPESLVSISDNAFAGCEGLISVTLAEGMEEIGANAFAGCTGLETIRLPQSLNTIADGAFDPYTGAMFWVHEGSYAHTYVREGGFEYSIVPNWL